MLDVFQQTNTTGRKFITRIARVSSDLSIKRSIGKHSMKVRLLASLERKSTSHEDSFSFFHYF